MVKFYKWYGKMLEDNIIDQRELEQLRPVIMQRHGREINFMKECDLQLVFDRIEEYNEEKAEDRKGHGFFRLKKLFSLKHLGHLSGQRFVGVSGSIADLVCDLWPSRWSGGGEARVDAGLCHPGVAAVFPTF